MKSQLSPSKQGQTAGSKPSYKPKHTYDKAKQKAQATNFGARERASIFAIAFLIVVLEIGGGNAHQTWYT